MQPAMCKATKDFNVPGCPCRTDTPVNINRLSMSHATSGSPARSRMLRTPGIVLGASGLGLGLVFALTRGFVAFGFLGSDEGAGKAIGSGGVTGSGLGFSDMAGVAPTHGRDCPCVKASSANGADQHRVAWQHRSTLT